MLEDPFILSGVLTALLPLVVAGLLVGFIGRMIDARAAGCAIALAFLVAQMSILGWPPLPPRSSLHKVAYIVLIGLLLGIVLDFLLARLPTRAIAAIWSAVIVVWLGWQQLIGRDLLDLVRLVLVWLAGAFVFDRLLALRTAGIVAPTIVLVGGIGMSAIAFIGSAASLSQLAAATAAATGGFLLWNWPQQRYPFAMTALFGAATALFAVATTIVLFTRASPLAMALLLGLFVAGAARKTFPLAYRDTWGPIVFGIIALIPVLLAVAVAFFTAPSADY